MTIESNRKKIGKKVERKFPGDKKNGGSIYSF